MTRLGLSDRMKQILRIVVEDYSLSGEPVGSRTISRESSLNLSPATIRNIMSDLEDLGLLYQPYTSAGRVPTERGFRFYVDYILDIHELDDKEQQVIRSQYSLSQGEVTDLFRGTSRVLSSASHYLGVVWAPRMNVVMFQHIEFVKLRKNLILAILVTTTGLVHNRIVEVEEDFRQSELDHLSDCMNELLTGLTLVQVREHLMEQMRMEKSEYDHLFQQTFNLGEKAFSSLDETDVFIEGRTNIIGDPEFGGLSKMAILFRAFEEKATMVRILDKCMDPKGVHIAIGSESQIEEIEPCSLVTSTYSFRGEVLGAVGVIGPRRMNYSKIVPLVEYTARLLTEMLESP
jgi:heat-inducible transcriptional repressor